MKSLLLFLLCCLVCIGCTNPERDRAALLKRELAETPILALQFDSLMQQVRRLSPTYRVDILLDVASRKEGSESVAKQEALVIETLPFASKKEKKQLLLWLIDYYGRFGTSFTIKDVRTKTLLRAKELEEQYSLSQEESWKIKEAKARTLKNLQNLEHSLVIYFELSTERRAAGKPELVIKDLCNMAYIFSFLGDHEKALSLQKEAYQLAVDNHLQEQQKQCYRDLVYNLFIAEKYAEVVNRFKETEMDFFASSEYLVYSRLANCHLHLNRPDSARFYLEKMVEKSEEARDAVFYQRIAETYLAENREEHATKAIGKMMACLREEHKNDGEAELEYSFSFDFLPINSSYATLLHRNGKNREALQAFHLIEPLMNEATVEDAILADQMEALTRYSSFCRSTRQFEKVSDLLARRDSLREIYNDMIIQRDSKKIADRFKTQELTHTIETQQIQLAYSNRILILVGVAVLVLGCCIVALVVFYRQRRKQLLAIQLKDQEITQLRASAASSSSSSSETPPLSPLEELFHAAEQKVATRKLFLNKELSLELLAHELDTNRSYLSSAINSYSGSNFSQWLNDYRIHYIQQRMCSANGDLIRLAEEAGFASANSFYRNFKRCTGMTPNEYLKQNVTELAD